MTIKNLYPKARPQTIYNVINGRPELPAASTFSRASEATYTDANGILRTAAVDEPRFNYDPMTGEFLGLMLEEARTNLRSTSNNFAPSVPPVTITTGSFVAPTGDPTATRMQSSTENTGSLMTVSAASQSDYTLSVFAKRNSGSGNLQLMIYDVPSYSSSKETFTLTDQWQRYSVTRKTGSGQTGLQCRVTGVNAPFDILVFGAQIEASPYASSYIETSGSPVTSAPDIFSLTSSSDFDGGFSLLLDSETTTDDYFYKIKASGTTIAELNNANGTLDWVVNGTSAATNGEYPQVGAIQPGRVRTISSFGAADGTTQLNYLYTYGLSFPTNAIVASGADEVEFGPGQTLKAVYLWNGQLSNTEAVSVIKGEYNIVPNEPIKADSYSFVYNTDPTNIGEATITLPYIVPTVSMRVYWGDGTNSAYEQGVTPSHTYPYPGQYRIQIEADDGFDAVRLADVNSTITRVDQWAPQHRVGATGDGFTGDDLKSILTRQVQCALIPPFKYTDLTNLDQAFWDCQKAAVNNWDWIPTNLQSATNLGSAFRTVSRISMSVAERGTFPQLQTSTALTSVTSCFRFNNFTQFDQGNSGLPFSNTQNVTNWSACFRDLARLTSIGALDTSAATTLSSTFNGCNNLAAMPFIATNNVINFSSAWQDCSALTSFPLIDTSSGTQFTYTWDGCSNLNNIGVVPGATTSLPLFDFSSATTLSNCFKNCSSITTVPVFDVSNATNVSAMFYGCTNLNNFPGITLSATANVSLSGFFSSCTSLTNFTLFDTSTVTSMVSMFYFCTGLTNFPASFDTSAAVDLASTWADCQNLTSFPVLNTANATSFKNAWARNYGLTDFPLLDTTSITNCDSSWYKSTNLANFPANMFDTTGTLIANAFNIAWLGCALTAQSIENILVSLDTNGQSNIVLGIDAGTNAGQSTWTAAANTAYTNLINKGWTITFNP